MLRVDTKFWSRIFQENNEIMMDFPENSEQFGIEPKSDFIANFFSYFWNFNGHFFGIKTLIWTVFGFIGVNDHFVTYFAFWDNIRFFCRKN